MTNVEFAKAVSVILETEKDTFKELLEKEDWKGIEDEVFYYVSEGE